MQESMNTTDELTNNEYFPAVWIATIQYWPIVCYGCWIKGLFHDSNNIILWHDSKDINKKSLLQKFELILILCLQVMHNYVWFITPIDCCVELIILDKTFCENCSHFIKKWFQPNSFAEICFLEERYKKMQNKKKKRKDWKFLERPVYEIREYAFKDNMIIIDSNDLKFCFSACAVPKI